MVARRRKVTKADLVGIITNGTGDHEYRYVGGNIPLGAINVLPQPRKTFANIPPLADDIADKGFINPPVVARFSPLECDQYLAIVNQLWGTEYVQFDLRSSTLDGREFYYVLLAGERRYRACWHLWERGCSDCAEALARKPKPGECFRKHFRGDCLEVRLCLDIPPIPALYLQLSENTHMSVPAFEEANAYSQLLRLVREADSSVTIAAFARFVGRSPSTIKNALWYCNLPCTIQKQVEDGVVAYGIGVQLARLQEQAGMDEDDLLSWMSTSSAMKEKVPELRRRVSEYLEQASSGQMSLAEMMTAAQELEMRHMARRQAVSGHTLRAIWEYYHYFGRLLQLCKAGLIGRKDSPFSHLSTVRIFRRLLLRVQEVLPHLRTMVPKTVLEQAEVVIPEADRLVGAIENGLIASGEGE